MTVQLSRPPAAELLRTDPDRYARDLSAFLNGMVQELERAGRAAEGAAKAVFAVTNIAAPTTTLDGATADLAAVINYLGGLHATLLALGVVRTKEGAG